MTTPAVAPRLIDLERGMARPLLVLVEAAAHDAVEWAYPTASGKLKEAQLPGAYEVMKAALMCEDCSGRGTELLGAPLSDSLGIDERKCLPCGGSGVDAGEDDRIVARNVS